MTARRAAPRPVVATLVALALLPSAAALAATSPAASPAGVAGAPTAGAVGAAPAALVVRATDAATAAAAVRAAGGTVRRSLPLVDAVAAAVPSASVDALRADPRVLAATPDARVSVAATTTPTAVADPGSTNSVYAREINADRLGATGAGVTVALIDTGVTEVADLRGRLVRVADPANSSGPDDRSCVDFSGSATCDDEYGHGTFLAGLVAGTGAASEGRYTGVAPGARIVSIKIAGRDGSADVSQVLAGIQWAVSFRDRYGIRVLNLSLGTDSRQPVDRDPLNLAVQKAWASGLTVVVSASNRGPAAGTVSKPGDDPVVVTVGSTDDRQTPAVDDDRLPRFTGRGAPGLEKPDVVVPGARLVSLRAPGSLVEATRGGGGFGSTDPRYAPYRFGSGTSMSAAVVSGAAAVLLEATSTPTAGGARAYWSPDRVKWALTTTARPVADPSRYAVGRGMVDLSRAAAAAPTPAGYNPPPARGSGGTLDASRGTVRVSRQCTDVERVLRPFADACSVEVRGDGTAGATTYDGEEYAAVEWDGTSWQGSQWAGTSWQGTSWQGTSWQETPDGREFSGASRDGTPEVVRYGDGVLGALWYGAWQ